MAIKKVSYEISVRDIYAAVREKYGWPAEKSISNIVASCGVDVKMNERITIHVQNKYISPRRK